VVGRASIGWAARIVTIALAATAWVAAPMTALGWSHGCGGPNPVTDAQDFVGMAEDHIGVTGARVKIEWSALINPVLCTTSGGDSFSSTWVAIHGNAPFDIYQVGIDKCQGDDCNPNSGPDNTAYDFTALGRNAGGPCGGFVVPVPIETSQGLADNGSFWFQIYKSNSTTYQARIAGSNAGVSVSTYYTDTCWQDGILGAGYFNEVWDIFDQTPGRTADKQLWSSATWTNSSGTLVSMNRPYSSACDAHDRSAMACSVAGNLHNAWNTYDTRQ